MPTTALRPPILLIPHPSSSLEGALPLRRPSVQERAHRPRCPQNLLRSRHKSIPSRQVCVTATTTALEQGRGPLRRVPLRRLLGVRAAARGAAARGLLGTELGSIDEPRHAPVER